MTWLEYVNTFWPILASLGGLILGTLIWCLRLEGKQSLHKEIADSKNSHLLHRIVTNEAHTTELYSKHHDLNEKLGKDISEMNKTLARIEGRLSIKSGD